MSELAEHPALLLYRKLGKLGDWNEDRVPRFVTQANAAWSGTAYQQLIAGISQRQRCQAEAYAGAGWSVGGAPYTVRWRLAVGVSYGRLWETGFQLHPLYGLPYLPASGIKGALRSWAYECGGRVFPESIFGDEERESKVVLFDAFPASGGQLLAHDVINKHHGPYFEAAHAPPPPTDADQPVPVAFFTLRRGVKLNFTWAIRPGESGMPALDPQQFSKFFTNCLRYAGLGAKTMKGYGRLVP